MISLMCNEAQRSDNEGSLQISLFIAHKAVLDAYILQAFTTNKKGKRNGPIRLVLVSPTSVKLLRLQPN